MSAKSPYRDQVECPKCDALESRVAKLERENTRLNAALEKFENIKPVLVHPFKPFDKTACVFCGNALFTEKDGFFFMKNGVERITCVLSECTKEHIEHMHIKCHMCNSWFIIAAADAMKVERR